MTKQGLALTSPVALAGAYGSEIGERYRLAPHIELMNDVILRALKPQGMRRLMIEMPPRHSKTQTTSHWTVVWLFLRNPRIRVILAAHTSDYAAELGGKVRNTLRILGPIFGVQVSGDSSAKDRWSTTAGGSMYAVGIGKAVTGRGANVIVIDDPHKDWAEAQSETIRASTWDWYTGTLRTRLHPGGSILLCQCLTGDTPVLMGSGIEKPLRDVRPGDVVATYEAGRLATSTVRRWANQGPDGVYAIRMRSGRVVRANARHPFLTITDEGLTWQRTDGLRSGSVILTVTGASGAVSPAPRKDATSPPSARACARPTTTNGGGLRAIGLPPSTRRVGEPHTSSTGTVSMLPASLPYWPSRTASAPSADSRRPTATPAPTGPGSSAWTTTTALAGSEGSSATTATSSSGTADPLPSFALPLPTWSLAPDEVAEVIPAGVEDVFDLQIDRTENFIANGLVSHNTRWHEEDLAGKLETASKDGTGEGWEVLRMTALCEQAAGDPLGRQVGDPLWDTWADALAELGQEQVLIETESPKDRTLIELTNIKHTLGAHKWAGLYQQNPAPPEGAIFKRQWWRWWSSMPSLELEIEDYVMSIDTSYKDKHDSDYMVVQVWAIRGADRFLLDQLRERVDFPNAVRLIRSMAGKWPQATRKYIEETANGPAIIATLRSEIPGIIPVTPKGDKVSRAHAVTWQVEGGNVYLPVPALAPWVEDFVHEHAVFPNGSNDDQVDTTTQFLHATAPATATAIHQYGYQPRR